MRSTISFAFTLVSVVAALGGCDSASESPIPGPDDDEAAATDPAFAVGTQQVLVTNTTARPVPTQAVGTTSVTGVVSATQTGDWNVSVAGGTVGASQAGAWSVSAKQEGPWSVGAAQQGPWTVDIGASPPVLLAPGSSVAVASLPPVMIAGVPTVAVAGTPAVTIANTPNVAVSGTVAIANTDDEDAIPVRVVGDAGGGSSSGRREAWVGGGQLVIDPGEGFESEQFFAVPPGKVLVVEQYTIDAAVPTGQVAYEATLLGSANGVGAIMRFPLHAGVKTLANFDRFVLAQQVTVNVSGGVIVAVQRNATTGNGLVNVALSGYLVDEAP